ncbi:MAG: response regulator [Deltaproteobacteria bacterium]|nr:response regulator [Deltaproteobacteria bacterium]
MSANNKKPGQGKRILLVEDNLHNRRIFAGVLTHYGFEVEEATDGAAAIEAAQRFQPDLILMDLSLPVLDGWEATRRIKAIDGLSDRPIIALTAHAMSGDRERALEAGCDDYMSKPIAPRQVVAEVCRILGLERD